jgi:hypothetical protein
VVSTLGRLQEVYDVAPDIASDPSKPIRLAVREFAAAQQCSSTTASFYLWAFGGKDGENMKQAIAEYERLDKADAPSGWVAPCDTHWLASLGKVLAGLGGKCVAKLCAGLKSEEDFATELFDGNCDTAAPGRVRELISTTGVHETLRQRWIGCE